MRCFFCDNDATAKIFTNIDGNKQEIDVCQEHMEEIRKFNFNEMCDDILAMFKFGGLMPVLKKLKVEPKLNSIEHLMKCPECFDIFYKTIVPTLMDIHARYHVKHNTAPLYRLRRDLEVAVKEERFEEAAKLRDEIKKLEESNGKKPE